MLVIQAVGFDVGNTSFLSFFVHLIPQFFRNNRLMDTVVKHIIVLLYHMILISCSWNLLILSSAKCKLATINRIIKYTVVSQNKVPVSCTKTANYYINSIMISLCACL